MRIFTQNMIGDSSYVTPQDAQNDLKLQMGYKNCTVQGHNCRFWCNSGMLLYTLYIYVQDNRRWVFVIQYQEVFAVELLKGMGWGYRAFQQYGMVVRLNLIIAVHIMIEEVL